jgi:LPS export ABC transporter permease LptG
MRSAGLLDRLFAREIAWRFLATLGGATVLYLVIDYADRSTSLGRYATTMAVVDYYANKAAVIVYQVAPGALIIAAAMLVSRLSRTGELNALFALGVSPLRVLWPLALFGATVGAGLFALGELVVVDADARMDQINYRVFSNTADVFKYRTDQIWLRGADGKRFYKLGRLVNGGFEPVTVLEVAEPFSLRRRLDARRLEPAGKKWRLIDVTETRSAPSPSIGGELQRRDIAESVESFPDTMADLTLRAGRPRQMRWRQLVEQTRSRERHGQPVLEWKLALAERASQAAVAIPGVLVGFLFALAALGSRRKQSMAASIALGLVVTSIFWATTTVAHAAALTGLLPPFLAGGLVSLVSAAAAAGLIGLSRV